MLRVAATSLAVPAVAAELAHVEGLRLFGAGLRQPWSGQTSVPVGRPLRRDAPAVMSLYREDEPGQQARRPHHTTRTEIGRL